MTPEVQPTASSSWRLFTAMANLLVDSGKYTDLLSIQDSLARAESDAWISEVPLEQLLQAPTGDHQAHIRERCIGLGLVIPRSSVPAQESMLCDEFDDTDFGDDEALSLEGGASAVRSFASVKLSELSKLALVSPRPQLDDHESVFPSRERRDFAIRDSCHR